MTLARNVARFVMAARQSARVNLMTTLEYRGAFLIWVLTDVLAPLISLRVWLVVADATGAGSSGASGTGGAGGGLPLDRGQLITYFLLVSVCSTATISWLIYLLPEGIRQGTLSVQLLRPASPVASYLGNNLGEKAVRLLLLVPVVTASGVPLGLHRHLPAEPGTWVLFGLAMLLAAALSFLLDLVVCSAAFWLQDVWGLSNTVSLLERLLQGKLVPLALFPAWAQGALEAQPFRYTLSFPLEILTGSVSPAGVVRGFAWSIGYCGVVWLVSCLLWRRGLRAYSAAGA